MSFDRLIERIERSGNPTVAGLDATIENIPEYIRENSYKQHGETFLGAANAILDFNKGLIDAICDIVPAVKPQCAYYELLGWEGVRVLQETIQYAKSKDMFVITDGKRNDIGTTMVAYAAAHLGFTQLGGTTGEAFGADALTVNGYLGSDGITPLLDICRQHDKGIFVLVKTSNPSSGELQDRVIQGDPVYELMGNMCENWGKDLHGRYGYSPVGAVVGATYPDQLRELREKLPHTFFLVPGYGAQGGKADDVRHAFGKNGIGAIVNNSRGLMYAWKKEGCHEREYAAAARRAAEKMRDDLGGVV
ncbi:MAG: orotidine-5'-phosphate decarboxylase [Oscillospiraceae bacterium]|nr:orotidine-5'-phosphate decarboxylase [Oscillospiraceae bacterium]